MKPSELRIGNLVERQIKGQSYVVDGINSHEQNSNIHVTCIDENDWKGMGYYCDIEKHLTPINLSEEWLERFGFKKDNFTQREFNREGDFNFKAINHYENGYLIICNFLQGGIMTKHIHHLQNIFYTLTGEELTISNFEKIKKA